MSSLSVPESVLVKELFVSSKTPVQCHLSRAVKHLELDNSVLILNGLGKAIITTIDVALKLQQQFHNTIKLDIQTSTAEIKDILEPLNEEDDYEERENMLAVFDFDHTIVDGNSDLIARDLIKPHDLIPNRKDNHNNWTQYMQQVFTVLKNIKISAEQVIDAVSLMDSIQGMPKLMRALKKSNIDIIVASDSNTLFIHSWLKCNKLSDIVSCVFTNPAKIEDGLIEIEPYTEQTTCNQCQKNMCKGLIVKEYISKTDKKYNKIFYFGDGSNDLCPVLKLTQNDIAFPRLGYALENLLKSHITQAKVIPWCTGDGVYEYLKTSNLITISNEDY